ncbi:hypothetical protein DER46DRAFT_652618 [Fusarium sp. MPI-SDFR-AT-0072]|nr:hypothetical protein DER46DRAFT_652618 [Fusarium sp. MPI-SDFR-AT-0072]
MQYSHGTTSPGLTIRYQNVVLQKHSPVFEELSKIHFSYLFRDRQPSGSDIISSFEDAERTILSLYRDGKASPSDRDEYGCNQAEIACGLITLFYNEIVNANITNTTRAIAVMAAIRLIKIISGVAGAEGGNIGATNMAVLLQNQEHEWIRFYATTFNLNWRDIIQRTLRSKDIRLSSLWPLICDSGQYYETPLLIQAIFQESGGLIQSYLIQHHLGVNQTFHGFTPFQLCIQWPEGIEMLLSSQINTPLDEDALWLAFRMIDDPSSTSGFARVITDYDPESSKTIRSETEEQQNFSLLEDLMQEFAQTLASMNSTSSFPEVFIWGYWRHRISKLFAVDPEFISSIEGSEARLDLYVLPERLRCLLGRGFELQRP